MQKIADKWRQLSLELRCVQNMMTEVIAYWNRWLSQVSIFEEWFMNANEHLLQKYDESEKLDFFQDVSIREEEFQSLNEIFAFLMSTSTDDTCHQLRKQFETLTNQWNELYPKVEIYMHSGNMLRNQIEFKKGIESINQWICETQQLIEKRKYFHSDEIKNHIVRLETKKNDVTKIDDTFKTISRLCQSLISDLGRDDVEKIMSILKSCKEHFVQTSALVSQTIHYLHQIVVQLKSIENAQFEIQNWIQQANQLFRNFEKTNGNEQYFTQLNKHNGFFSKIDFYKSLLESKSDLLKQM